MSTQLSIMPDMPRGRQVVDMKTGQLLPEWELFFSQMAQSLQTIFKPEGFVMPQKTTAEIAQLTGDASARNILYDSDSDEFKGNVLVAGVPTWKTFTLV